MELKRDTGMQCKTYHATGNKCDGCDKCMTAEELNAALALRTAEYEAAHADRLKFVNELADAQGQLATERTLRQDAEAQVRTLTMEVEVLAAQVGDAERESEKLTVELAGIRDLFPIPRGGDLEAYWAAAMADPMSIFKYVRKCVRAAHPATVGSDGLRDAITEVLVNRANNITEQDLMFSRAPGDQKRPLNMLRDDIVAAVSSQPASTEPAPTMSQFASNYDKAVAGTEPSGAGERDTIRDLAKEAGFDWHAHWNDDESNRLERFAELLAARAALASPAQAVLAQPVASTWGIFNLKRNDWCRYGDGKIATYGEQTAQRMNRPGDEEARELYIYAAPQPVAIPALPATYYEEALAEHHRLVRALDVALNGANAAQQASLCDLVAQVGSAMADRRNLADHSPEWLELMAEHGADPCMETAIALTNFADDFYRKARLETRPEPEVCHSPVCDDRCAFPSCIGPKVLPQPVAIPNGVRRALAAARDLAMKQCAAARVPESGDFGAIAQHLDWAIDQLSAAPAPQAGDDGRDAEYELYQGYMLAAGASGKDAWREIQHYAAQYSQDGPVEIYEVIRRKIEQPADGGDAK